MPLSINKCIDDDFPRLFEIFSVSFGLEHPLINTIWPQHWTPVGRSDGAERFLDEFKTDPHTSFVKVTDTDLAGGTIVGWAKWNVHEGVIPPSERLDGRWWDQGKGDKNHAQETYRVFSMQRRAALKRSKGNLVVLDVMCVDPAHQRRGVGKSLMEWGMTTADQMGVEVVVEASDPGRKLYEALGFTAERLVEIVLPEPWAGLKNQSFWWMTRPRKGEKELIQR